MTQSTVTPDGASPRIVVGVDPSDNAARAAAWAAREAADRGLPLHLVHAIDLPGSMGMVIEPPDFAASRARAGQKILDRVAADLAGRFPGLTVTTEVSELGPAETLVARSAGARLVVTGTRGHGGFAGMLLGSVSHALAAHAHCPAVVVRGEEPAEPLGEIVVGVEPGQAEAPVRFAFETAATVGASVTVVRAWWPAAAYSGYGGFYAAPDLAAIQTAEEADVATLVKAVREEFPHVDTTTRVIRGNPVPVLTNAALGSRLLVVGSHRRRGPLSVGIGYVDQGLLSHSPTPVAVVPIV